MELSSENVHATLRKCLFNDDELNDGKPPMAAVLVEGIVSKFGFHKGRLEAARQDVQDMLSQLPAVFSEGMSFLNACDRKDGQQWGEHRSMDLLFCMGLGLGLVTECLPKDMWHVLPGGMPYYCVPCAADSKTTIPTLA